MREFLDALSDDEVADIVAAMKDVATNGLRASRHLRGDIYEVRTMSSRQSFRILFAREGTRGNILLALEALSKK